MDFAPTEEQAILSDMALRFIRDRDAHGLARNVDAIVRRDWAEISELGWLAIAFPEDLGGIGGDPVDIAVLMSSLGRGYVLSPFVVTAILCGSLIARSHAHRELVADVISGDLRLALAHDEASISTFQLVAVTEGNGSYRLSGRKFMVLSAPLADKVIVSAQVAGEDRLSLFVLDRDAPGMEWDEYVLLDGTSAADLTLSEAVADEADQLVLPDGAEAALVESTDLARIALLAEAVGAMEASLEICGAYVKEREQFGQPIGKFQALQQVLAEMFVEVQDARSALYYALSQAHEDFDARAVAVSAAKVAIGSAAKITSRHAIQLHGGYGMTDEFVISHHYRRLMAFEKLLGDTDRHISGLAGSLLDKIAG